MHLAPLIHDLSVILGVAAVVTFIFKRIRQPVVIGYVLAGLIVGPHVLPWRIVQDLPNVRALGELGVVFLMFSLGLEFSFRKLARVGISTALTAVFEVICMFVAGYFVGRLFGLSAANCLFLAAMVSISSTTIIIKALDELRLKMRRFAAIVFGVLIVEDLLAILMLVALPTIVGTGAFSGLSVLFAAGKLLFVIGSWFVFGYFLLPRFVRYVGRVGNDELLTVLAIGLCLLLVVLASYLGYSSALAAFIMGSILAESTESARIEELIRPVKDVFAAVFFVSVGMLIDPVAVWQHAGVILALSALVIFGKIFFATSGAIIAGQTLRTSLQVGFTLGQIGEFSFIIAGVGLVLGAIDAVLYPVAVAVCLLTAFVSPYLIRFAHRFALIFEDLLPPRVREGFIRYAAWSESRRADRQQRALFYSLSLRWFLNGLVASVIFILSAKFFVPFLGGFIATDLGARILGWVVALLLSAPFIWGMFAAFKIFSLPTPHGGTLFVSRFLAVCWIGVLSISFFSAKVAVLITGVATLFLFVRFYRQLEVSYNWFERNFAATFENAEKTARKKKDLLRMLAPWDAHLVRFKVHPDSPVSGQRLIDSGLRKQYGINVVAIQRGSRTVVAPKPDFQLFPDDEVLVLANDEQVDKGRYAFDRPAEGSAQGAGAVSSIEGYELKGVRLGAGSPLLGKTIRTSELREKFGSTVVGVERGSRRIVNPRSDMTFQMDDVLWLVGETNQIERIGDSSGLRAD